MLYKTLLTAVGGLLGSVQPGEAGQASRILIWHARAVKREPIKGYCSLFLNFDVSHGGR